MTRTNFGLCIENNICFICGTTVTLFCIWNAFKKFYFENNFIPQWFFICNEVKNSVISTKMVYQKYSGNFKLNHWWWESFRVGIVYITRTAIYEIIQLPSNPCHPIPSLSLPATLLNVSKCSLSEINIKNHFLDVHRDCHTTKKLNSLIDECIRLKNIHKTCDNVMTK